MKNLLKAVFIGTALLMAATTFSSGAQFAVWLDGDTTPGGGGNAILTEIDQYFGVGHYTLVTTAQLETSGFLNTFDCVVVSRFSAGFGTPLSATAAANVAAYVGAPGPLQGGVALFSNDIADNLFGASGGDPYDANLDALFRNGLTFAAASHHGYIGEFNGAVMGVASNTSGYPALGLLAGSASAVHFYGPQFIYGVGPIGGSNPIDTGVSFPFTDSDQTTFLTDITGADSNNIVDIYLSSDSINGEPAVLANHFVISGGGGLLTLNPAVATNNVGTAHTVCATATTVDTNGVTNVVVGTTVTFDVTSGPNATVNGSSVTDSNGVACLTYAGTGGAGTDTIMAQFIDNLGRTNTAFATKIWIGCELTITCPSDIVATNDQGQCSAVVNYPSPIVTCTNAGVVVTCTPAPGSFPVGTTGVICTATDVSSNQVSCSFTVTVEDHEAPQVACRPAPNPSGKKIPVSGKNPSSGQNPDGYYQLLTRDNCDPNPAIYVQDTGSAFRAGPFANGDIVKLKQNPGGTPTSSPGNPPITAEIHLNGDGLAIAVDAAGNVTPNGCLMLIPPDPK